MYIMLVYCNIDDALVALATNCPYLRLLFLDDLYQITDVGLAALARSCTSLRFVALAEQIRTAYIDTIHTFPSTVKVYVYETPQGGENEEEDDGVGMELDNVEEVVVAEGEGVVGEMPGLDAVVGDLELQLALEELF